MTKGEMAYARGGWVARGKSEESDILGGTLWLEGDKGACVSFDRLADLLFDRVQLHGSNDAIFLVR